MAQEAKGDKASVTTSCGCQRQFEEPYAGKPQVRFRGGAAAAMPAAYSTIVIFLPWQMLCGNCILPRGKITMDFFRVSNLILQSTGKKISFDGVHVLFRV